MKRCRYCHRDISEKPGTALWIDGKGFWICSQENELPKAHLPA